MHAFLSVSPCGGQHLLTNSGEKRPREEKRKEWKRKGAASVRLRLRLLLLHVCAERAAAAAVVVVEVLAVGGVEPACFPAMFPKAGREREGVGNGEGLWLKAG